MGGSAAIIEALVRCVPTAALPPVAYLLMRFHAAIFATASSSFYRGNLCSCTAQRLRNEQRCIARRCFHPLTAGHATASIHRGVTKKGGRVLLRSHVDEIVMEGGRAAGVRLRPRGGAGAAAGKPEIIRAKLGVVSNASWWDTQRLLPKGAASGAWKKQAEDTPAVRLRCFLSSVVSLLVLRIE